MKLFPVILAFQSLLFFIPWLIWRYASNCRCNLNCVLQESKIHTGNIASLSQAAESLFLTIKKLVQPPWPLNGGGTGILAVSFLAVRAFYWIICFVQIIIISAYFNIDFTRYNLIAYPRMEATTGAKAIDIDKIANETGHEALIESASAFPMVILCDFNIQQMGNVHIHTVMCNLDLSETTKLHLAAVWYWLVPVLLFYTLVGFAQIVQTFMWLVGPAHYKLRYLQQRVPEVNETTTAQAVSFAETYLKLDVMFVLAMVEESVSVGMVREALSCLWQEHTAIIAQSLPSMSMDKL